VINDLPPITTINPLAESLVRYFIEQTREQMRSTTPERVTVKSCAVNKLAAYDQEIGM
jgi:hypothetical protein